MGFPVGMRAHQLVLTEFVRCRARTLPDPHELVLQVQLVLFALGPGCSAVQGCPAVTGFSFGFTATRRSQGSTLINQIKESQSQMTTLACVQGRTRGHLW